MSDFGTLVDFERLLGELKSRNLRVILDLVPNHSSDRHPWFVASRQARNSPFRDYYHWRAPRNGAPPNNWRSFFGGPAWTFDEATQEYYLHLFSKHQADLNWENPRVRREIHDIMRFWLEKGIDGFRLDAITFISKDPSFPDAPPGLEGELARVYANGPRLHEYLHELNREVLSRYDVATVGEGAGVAAEQAPLFVNERRQELHMLYHFDHMSLDRVRGDHPRRRPGGFTLPEFKAIFSRWDRALGDTGWNSVLLGNHDFPRMVSRFGNDGDFRVPAAKMLGTLLLTMKGTPFIYQGDELGMTNGVFARIEDFDDVATRNVLYGSFEDLDPSHPGVFAYRRRLGPDEVVVVLSFRDAAQAYVVPGVPRLGEVLLSNYPGGAVAGPKLGLRPFDAVVRRCD